MQTKENAWHFVDEEGTQQGPFERDALLGMRASGFLTDETLVWSADLDGWRPFSSVFTETFPAPRRTTRGSENVYDGDTHPWRRYFAKLLDFNTIGTVPLMVLTILLAAILPEQADWALSPLDNAAVASLALVGFWIPMEALCLFTFGATPGRWVFGIAVRDSIGEKLDPRTAFARTLRLTVQGLGLGIPIIQFFTNLFTYLRLCRTGTTLWDTSSGTVVTHSEWGPWRGMLCLLAILASVVVVLGLHWLAEQG